MTEQMNELIHGFYTHTCKKNSYDVDEILITWLELLREAYNYIKLDVSPDHSLVYTVSQHKFLNRCILSSTV